MQKEAAISLGVMRHKVADYAVWRPVFDKDEPRRSTAGLKSLGVFRDADDPNMILMLTEVKDRNVLMAMLASPDLAAEMQAAGVMGKPEVWLSRPLGQGGSTVFLRHQVADYSAWKPVYDADAPMRAAAGMTEIGVYRDADNPNMVLMAANISNPTAIMDMLASPELAEKMKQAGVVSKPEVWMGDQI